MDLTRRHFLQGVAVGSVAAALGARGAWCAEPAKIRLSACDWSLGAAGAVSALDVAKSVGLEGLEISAARGETMLVSDGDLRKQYKDAAAKLGLAISSIAMGQLNDFPLATDDRAAAWLDQTIAAAGDLGAPVILLAFFGKGDLLEGKKLKKKEMDAVVQKIKDAAPKAKEANVVLGIENYLSAEQNLALLDQINHDSVRIYYDVGNSTVKKYDVPKEIRTLGNRICQIHFKDGDTYLGKGKVDMAGAAESIAAINYKGWIVLETSCPSKDREKDFAKNIQYTRKLMKL